MFKISPTPSYKHPVKVSLPGEAVKQSFDAEFLRLSQADIDAWLEKIKEGHVKDADVVRAVLIGWAGVADQNGVELPFCASALEAAIQVYPFASSVVEAFFESIAGARLKN